MLIGSETTKDLGTAPAIVGLGKTGLRIVSLIAARRPGAFRFLAVLPEGPPAGPTPVPILAWPSEPDRAAAASVEAASRIGKRRSVIVALNLGSSAAVSVAPVLARAIRASAGTLAVVGVTPFAFEGPERIEDARAAAGALLPVVDMLAVASREVVRELLPATTPLDAACAHVDDAAATAAEAMASAFAANAFARDESGGPPAAWPLGAADSRACSVSPFAKEGRGQEGRREEGPSGALDAGHLPGAGGALAAATRVAVERSLVGAERFASAREALVVLAAGTTPTIGDLGAAESAVRAALPAGAAVSIRIAVDRALGGRALAAVLVRPAVGRDGRLFPSEDPATLEVPAFLRRRAAGAASIWLTAAERRSA